MPERLLIVTDAWKPQLNGVVVCLEHVSSILAARGMDVQFIEPSEFRTVQMPTYPEIHLAMNWPGEIGERIEGLNPDFIHLATEGPLGLQARLHCHRHGLRFTSSFHTRFPEYVAARMPIPAELVYGYLRWFHSDSQGTLVATASLLSELHERGFRHLRQWTRGVDHTRFHPGPKTWFADLPAPHLLYVGRVAPEKNITAFLDLEVQGSKIVVGDGPQLEALQHAYPGVIFLGRRVGAELAEIYRSADLFVFPSLTDTFGNVMIEALASGLPVAAFPVTGPIDVLTDPNCAALNEDLGAAVETALTLSRDAAARHGARFSWDECTDIFARNLQSAHGILGAVSLKPILLDP